MRPRRATIIFNPVSGRNMLRDRKVRKMIRLLEEHGLVADAAATSGPNTGATLAREAIRTGSDMIICLGGDGTLNEVLQGVACGDARLAIWAGGTANVTARDIKMPRRMKQVADVIARGNSIQICLGMADDGRIARYFLMFAGIGLDASICRGVNPRLKRFTGEFAFWVSGIRHLVNWRGKPFSITVDGEICESGFSLIANGKGYGGGIRMAPAARLEAPVFEVFIMPNGAGRMTYLRALINAVAGRTTQTVGRLITAANVAAQSASEIWVEVDGEPIGTLPMRFSVVPQALSIVVP